jgi:hypothetical protein
MVRILLPCGRAALIDDADELLAAGFAWRALDHQHGMTYVHAWNGRQHFYLHRLISGAAAGERVDHENRNGLDCQRRNLRIATPGQNGANRIADRRRAGTSSQHKGVCWDKARGKWAAYIHVDGKTRGLGRFDDELDAARAYDTAAVAAWGRFARLNLPAA